MQSFSFGPLVYSNELRRHEPRLKWWKTKRDNQFETNKIPFHGPTPSQAPGKHAPIASCFGLAWACFISNFKIHKSPQDKWPERSGAGDATCFGICNPAPWHVNPRPRPLLNLRLSTVHSRQSLVASCEPWTRFQVEWRKLFEQNSDNLLPSPKLFMSLLWLEMFYCLKVPMLGVTFVHVIASMPMSSRRHSAFVICKITWLSGQSSLTNGARSC